MLRLSFALIGCVLTMGRFVPPVLADDLQFFETEVRPLLTEHCYECHAGESRILRAGCGWIIGRVC